MNHTSTSHKKSRISNYYTTKYKFYPNKAPNRRLQKIQKNIRSLYIAISLLLATCIGTAVNAQCPVSISVTSTVVTPASCPSNGSFTINATVGTGATYQITNGPVGYPAAAQNNNTFNSLLPGTYTVKVACQADPSIFTTTTITIQSTYTLVAATSVVNNICTGGTPGTITTTASGSSTPFTYAYWQGDPAAADATLTYGASNTFVVPAFGIYNVRTKDACGQFVTQQVTIANPYPDNLCITSLYFTKGNLTCAQLQDSIMSNFVLGTNLPFSVLPAAGIDIDVYENTGTCASPVQGLLVSTTHYDNTSNTNGIVVPKGKNLLYIVRTPCGASCTYCYTYDSYFQHFEQNFEMISNGCVAAGDPITYSFTVKDPYLPTYPITWVIKNSLGVTVDSFTANSNADLPHTFNGLPADNYTSIATDGCGFVVSDVAYPPTGTPNELSTNVQTFTGCSSVEGRTILRVYFTGVMANMANATTIIIAPSPNLIGVAGLYGGYGSYMWDNAIPGATYYIEIDNQCGQKDTVSIIVPTGTGLVQHTNSTVQQLCGGAGNIIVDAAYNGGGAFSYQITNSANTVVGTGSAPGGTYSNLAADTYTIISTVLGCTNNYSYSSQVTILPFGTAPVITKKLGVICEDALGNPLTTGSAMLSFIGASPFIVDYKLTSGPDSNYINITDSSMGAETIAGLTAYKSYTIRVTDNCGNAVVTEITIGQLQPLSASDSLQPCPGSPYTLSVPDLVDATYSWTKNGFVISTNREIVFPNYTAGDDGTYTCTIVIANCLTRIVNATLNSTLCSAIITLSGNVYHDLDGINDNLVDNNGNAQPASELPAGLTANLFDATTGAFVGTTPILADGSYMFPVNPNTNYIVILSNIAATAADSVATFPSILPAGWLNVGDVNPTDPQATLLTPGISNIVEVGTTSQINVDFGIEQPPAADPKSQFVNLIGSTMPAGQATNPISGTDPEQGILGNSDTITITKLPVNATMYYNGIEVTVGQIITDFNPALLSYTNISNGSLNVIFEYAFIDSASQQGTPAEYKVEWLTPLPIQLICFSGTADNCNSILSWVTQNEIDFSHFELERSANNTTFEKISIINGQTGGGEKYYSYIDKNLPEGNYIYRLKLIDIDNKFNYSKSENVNIKCTADVLEVYPNPVSNDIYINLKTQEAASFEIKIFDLSGKLILSDSFETNENEFRTLHYSTAHLSKGVYSMNISNGYTKYVYKIIKN